MNITFDRVVQFAALLAALSAAVSAYYSYQAAFEAERSIQQSRSLWQEDYILKQVDKWDSLQMLHIRAKANKLQPSDHASATRHLRRILDYFDQICEKANRGIIPAESVEAQLGYWLWGYYQVWQQEIATLEKSHNMHWDEFRQFQNWLRQQEWEDMASNERDDFIKEEAGLIP